MLLGSLDQLPFRLLALLVGITIHEFSHAAAASALGDKTARQLGRLTLNPIRHLDLTGTLLMFLVGFGWGKPVPVDTTALRRGRRGMAIVAGAGPISNILVAAVATIPLRLQAVKLPTSYSFTDVFQGGVSEFISVAIFFIILFNILLAVFNLIPLFPLDGSSVALGLLPHREARKFARMEKYGPGILMIAIGVDVILGFGIIWGIMRPVINYLTIVLLGQGFF